MTTKSLFQNEFMLKRVLRWLLTGAGAIVLLIILGIALLWIRAYKPEPLESVAVRCTDTARPWSASTPLKVMSFNVQYMASKNYVFFYDIDTSDQTRVQAVLDSGQILAGKPSRTHVIWTLDQVAALIITEAPDIVMLQEVNGVDDVRTHYIDQVQQLLDRLPNNAYPCHAQTTYWRAEFIFHPDILGPVDMRLATLSKHLLTESTRHQLPRPERNFIAKPFYLQRALLESRMASSGRSPVAIINTHLEAWGAGTGIMQKQISFTQQLLDELDQRQTPWILGGDLNLLPPDGNVQRRRILAARTGNYDENTAIKPLYNRYAVIPSLDDLREPTAGRWYTYFPNDPTVTGPDRTIDYLIMSDNWHLQQSYVIQEPALELSDHLPVIGTLRLTID